MSESPKVRRQVYLLTEADLTEFPIWEFCSEEEGEDGQDEATVRPSEQQEVPGYSPGTYIVAADVMLADGTHLPGYLYSGKPDDMGCLQPNIVGEGGQVNLWMGMRAFVQEGTLPALYERLGKNATEVFPLSLTTRRKINGGLMTLHIAGFMALEKDRNVSTFIA